MKAKVEGTRIMLRNRFKISSFLKKRSQPECIFMAGVVCLFILLRMTTFVQTRLYNSLLPSTIEHRFDSVYSIALQERFIQASNDQRALLNDHFTPERFIESLKKLFPYLSAFEWEYISCDSVRIKVSGPYPRVVVNDCEVILHDSSWSSINNFDSAFLEYLAHITVENREDPELADHLLKIAASVFPGFFKQYDMTYRGFYDVLLQPKNSLCNYLLQVTADFFFNPTYKECLALIDTGTVETEKNYVHKRGTRIVYDMRFKDRIYRKSDTTV